MSRSAFAVAALVLAAPSLAAAHPSALSTFDARTDGPDVAIAFQIDATSVVDLIERATAGTVTADKPAIPDHSELVLAYLDARFAVGNGDTACRRGAPLRLEYAAATDKVALDLRYHCGPLTELRLSSTLFHDEATPHAVIGTVRHAALLERTFFTRGEQTARIDLRRVPMPAPGTIGSRQFRMATPPPPGARPPVTAAAPAAVMPAGTPPWSLLVIASAAGLGILVWLVRRRVLR